ncbi:hypothetical protein [Culicoidibacter larvae]|uniref:MobA/MobL protein domain-containing protein n=1 Tax=Culicoidibacter larvae TaxID=2579976 RepID=A0A5R8Q6S2_9FIRM|nr:hypothetical protein [Culicoidibacter larvae]TLG70293.1 hypothetical protein FEZ08_11805 [Culicoidibacter larvae]
MKRSVFVRTGSIGNVRSKMSRLRKFAIAMHEQKTLWKRLIAFEQKKETKNQGRYYLIELPNAWRDREDIEYLCTTITQELVGASAAASWYLGDFENNLHLTIVFSERHTITGFQKHRSDLYMNERGHISRVAKEGFELKYKKDAYKLDNEGKRVPIEDPYTPIDKSLHERSHITQVKKIVKALFIRFKMELYVLFKKNNIAQKRYKGIRNEQQYIERKLFSQAVQHLNYRIQERIKQGSSYQTIRALQKQLLNRLKHEKDVLLQLRYIEQTYQQLANC